MRLPSFTLHSLPTLVDHLGGDHAANIRNPITHHPLYHPSPRPPSSPPPTSSSTTSSTASDDSGGLTAYHRVGPCREVTFDPARVRATIVTCGGFCPGTNTIVRELVVGLWELYDVRAIFGVQNGYRGFYSEEDEPLPLEPATVHH